MTRSLAGAALVSIGIVGGCRAAAPPSDSRNGEGSLAAAQLRALENELQRWGGDYDAWYDGLAGFHDDLKAMLAARPADAEAVVGRDDWLFYWAGLEYLLWRDLRTGQRRARNPYDAVVRFDRRLRERGIALVFAPVPTKEEVYPEKVALSAPQGGVPYVCPAQRQLLRDLAAAGVRVADLLPTFVDHREVEGELLYRPHDAHWNSRGIRLAAKLIAETVRGLPQYQRLRKPRVVWADRTASVTQLGELVEMLPEDQRGRYAPVNMSVALVVDDTGAPYTDQSTSPVLLFGDSNAGRFEVVPGQGHGGLSAHLARELGVPIHLMCSAGAGPAFPRTFARLGSAAIGEKRIVIWTVTDRDLWSSMAPWTVTELP